MNVCGPNNDQCEYAIFPGDRYEARCTNCGGLPDLPQLVQNQMLANLQKQIMDHEREISMLNVEISTLNRKYNSLLSRIER